MITIVVTVPSSTAGEGDASLSIRDPALLGRVIGIGFGIPQVTVVLLGVLAFTQEVRYGTATSTFLVEPRRHRVLVAKGVALILAGVVVAAASLVVSFVLSVALVSARHGTVTIDAELGQIVAAVFVMMALYGLIGLAIGALVRNQIVAVVAALVWLTAAEHLLIDALPAVERWTPGGATYGLLQLGTVVTTRGMLLDAPIGGLLLAGYTATAVAAALIVAPRRDIL